MSNLSVVEQSKKLDALIRRRRELVGEHEDILRTPNLTEGLITRSNDLERAIDKLSDQISLERAAFEQRLGVVDDVTASASTESSANLYTGESSSFGFNVNRGAQPSVDRSVWSVDLERLNPTELVSRAHKAVDVTAGRKLDRVTDEAIGKAFGLLSTTNASELSRAATWALATSDPAYETAFAKLIRDPQRGHLEWSEVERSAYARVTNVARAMSLTDANGGFMVPFTLDPAIMLTNDGSNNPLRQLARVVQTTTDTWNGITSAGATSEWKTEGSQAADGSPTIAQPSIPTFLGDAFIPASFEYLQDADSAMTELSRILVDSADNLMSTAYTTGGGTTEPQGIVTGLVGTASEINTTGSEAIVAADAFALQNALPARFSANATWQSHIAIANIFRQFETTNGALQFPELRQTPPYLLGKRWFENSNMDSAYNAAATANNYVAIYGDVKAGFTIVDRIGSTLELIPNLLGANGRPTGQRGLLLWFRTGSEVVVPQALRMLDVPTTA